MLLQFQCKDKNIYTYVNLENSMVNIIKKIKKKGFNYFLKLFRKELFYSYIDDMFLVIQNLKERGYSPNIVLDIGAYKGTWTQEVYNIFPAAHFLMFEAQKDKEIYLQNITHNNQNIDYFIGLLGSKPESNVNFYLMETGSSVLYENTDHVRSKELLSMNTLDNVLQHVHMEKSCFLKIDVQGFELEVLKGAANVLLYVDLILLETSTLEYNQGSPLMHEVIQFMHKHGFIVYDVCSPKRTSKEHVLFQLDIFFIRKESPFRKIEKF